MKEFVIGDLHFFDKNIIRFGCRPFQSVLEMNEMLIKNWNGVVNKNDVVYVIGDFFDFGNCNIQDIHNTIAQLNGTIVLIVGNHDLPYVENLRTLITVIDYPIVKDGFWILSHEPMYVSMNTPYANIFAHVHKNPMYRDVSQEVRARKPQSRAVVGGIARSFAWQNVLNSTKNTCILVLFLYNT